MLPPPADPRYGLAACANGLDEHIKEETHASYDRDLRGAAISETRRMVIAHTSEMSYKAEVGHYCSSEGSDESMAS